MQASVGGFGGAEDLSLPRSQNFLKRGLIISFADNLKQIRKEKGLSQEELAELLSVSSRRFPSGKSGTAIRRSKSCLYFRES
ncbi:MAG: helix-turn-helix transcriptional regulator [Eubacteriales bacterium]|nr:helix-turn-helix transcriptional regulator [Eubacteriales bacterium]MDD3880974.1 helix-turn-helix transcriptional regulator [Eubacteriales bacterium]MDD4511957.1 helix-turn-helix transcriptional regulator [Eubacteriales bacterium]